MPTPTFLRDALARKRIRLHLWLENDAQEGFGSGRILLLERIDALGSLSKAARSLGMSYRGAWGKIKKAEEIIGFPLLDPSRSRREGCALTPEARELIRLFALWSADIQKYAELRALELFNDFSIK